MLLQQNLCISDLSRPISTIESYSEKKIVKTCRSTGTTLNNRTEVIKLTTMYYYLHDK